MMKHLKSYKLFESHTDDIIENVKDILLPINDMGYDVSIVSNDYAKELFIRVVTWTDKPLLMTNDVKEEFIRMKDYLQSEGYNSIEVKFYLENRSQDETPYKRAEKDIDGFINIEGSISNLLFNAKKKL